MVKVLLINALLLLHPLHISLSTITQEPGNDTIKVFFRMYYDDFMRDYKLYDPTFKAVAENDTIIVPDDHVESYFNERVNIFVNRKLLQGRLDRITNESYEVHLCLIYLSDRKPRNFRIRSHILTRVYSDQANMVYLNLNGYEDAMKLTVDNSEDERNLR